MNILSISRSHIHNQPFTASEKEQRKTSSIHFPLLVCVHGCIQNMRARTSEPLAAAHTGNETSRSTLCDGIARIRHFSALHQALNIPSSASPRDYTRSVMYKRVCCGRHSKPPRCGAHKFKKSYDKWN